MKAWKIAGALVSHIGMTKNSKELYHVQKAVFPLVASCDVNIVVASTKVKLGVDNCTADLVEEVCDQGDWVPILASVLVEVSEVDTELQGAIFLFGKRTGAPTSDWDDQMNPLPRISSMNSRMRLSSAIEQVDVAMRRHLVILKVNLMIKLMMRMHFLSLFS